MLSHVCDVMYVWCFFAVALQSKRSKRVRSDDDSLSLCSVDVNTEVQRVDTILFFCLFVFVFTFYCYCSASGYYFQ